MKISYNWLKDYVDVTASPHELANTLTMAGLEVESVERIGGMPEGIVVGEVRGAEAADMGGIARNLGAGHDPPTDDRPRG